MERRSPPNSTDMFQPRSFSLLPPVIKNLLIINGLAYFASIVFAQMGLDLLAMFGLYLPQSPEFQPYQLVTHLFFHDLSNFSHIFGNMFALWMFGIWVVLQMVIAGQQIAGISKVSGAAHLGGALAGCFVWFVWRINHGQRYVRDA